MPSLRFYLKLIFDNTIQKVDISYGSYTRTYATSGEELGISYEPGNNMYLDVTLQDGYVVDTTTLGTVDGNRITVPADSISINAILNGTITSKQQGGQDMSETWVLNETIDVSVKKTYYANFTTSGTDITNWKALNVTTPPALEYYPAESDGAHEVYSEFASGWTNTAYRTITFAEPITDSTLLTWLQANGVKQIATVNYIISETELTTIADSIRTKTSSSDKLTPSAMVEKIKTIPTITDVNDAATLTAKLTENNIGNFYRYTGTATSDYATGVIYQVTQSGGAVTEHKLTIEEQYSYGDKVTVNDNVVTSPYTLQNGDVIKVPTLTQGITINGTSYNLGDENVLNINGEDITVVRTGAEKTIDPVPYITINYTA